MPVPTPANAKTEIRLDQSGRLSAYFCGVKIPGVTNIEIVHNRGERATVNLRLFGGAVRIATENISIDTVAA